MLVLPELANGALTTFLAYQDAPYPLRDEADHQQWPLPLPTVKAASHLSYQLPESCRPPSEQSSRAAHPSDAHHTAPDRRPPCGPQTGYSHSSCSASLG